MRTDRPSLCGMGASMRAIQNNLWVLTGGAKMMCIAGTLWRQRTRGCTRWKARLKSKIIVGSSDKRWVLISAPTPVSSLLDTYDVLLIPEAAGAFRASSLVVRIARTVHLLGRQSAAAPHGRNSSCCCLPRKAPVGLRATHWPRPVGFTLVADRQVRMPGCFRHLGSGEHLDKARRDYGTNLIRPFCGCLHLHGDLGPHQLRWVRSSARQSLVHRSLSCSWGGGRRGTGHSKQSSPAWGFGEPFDPCEQQWKSVMAQ